MVLKIIVTIIAPIIIGIGLWSLGLGIGQHEVNPIIFGGILMILGIVGYLLEHKLRRTPSR